MHASSGEFALEIINGSQIAKHSQEQQLQFAALYILLSLASGNGLSMLGYRVVVHDLLLAKWLISAMSSCCMQGCRQ